MEMEVGAIGGRWEGESRPREEGGGSKILLRAGEEEALEGAIVAVVVAAAAGLLTMGIGTEPLADGGPFPLLLTLTTVGPGVTKVLILTGVALALDCCCW